MIIVDAVAHGLERIFYNAYGMPECFPFGDLNGDYTVTVADRTIFDNIKNGGANEKYNILGDVDLDPDSHRDSDATDRSIMSTYYLGLTGGSNVLSVDEVANDIGYAGYIFNDESQNYHVRNREYSPQLGRFLQRDPLEYPDGYNLYQYVMSNPLNYTDPFGLLPKKLPEWVEDMFDMLAAGCTLALIRYSFILAATPPPGSGAAVIATLSVCILVFNNADLIYRYLILPVFTRGGGGWWFFYRHFILPPWWWFKRGPVKKIREWFRNIPTPKRLYPVPAEYDEHNQDPYRWEPHPEDPNNPGHKITHPTKSAHMVLSSYDY